MKKANGFLIIEVLLAIVILSMIFLTLFTVLSFTTNRTEKSKYDSQAANVLQQGMELTRTTLLANWSDTTTGTYYPVYDADSDQWNLTKGTEAIIQGRFSRTIKIQAVCRNPLDGTQLTCPGGNQDGRSKMIDITITWKEGNIDKTVESTLLVFNNKS